MKNISEFGDGKGLTFEVDKKVKNNMLTLQMSQVQAQVLTPSKEVRRKVKAED